MVEAGLVREYRPRDDKKAIIDICKDVYDGRDYIPRVIDGYGSETEVLVEVEAGTSLPPRALICGRQDGSLYHLWGARTHPDHRGKSIMRRMMRHVHERVASTIISTTISANTAMVNLFESEGYVRHDSTIQLWPDSSVMEEADCTMDYVLQHCRSKRRSRLTTVLECRDVHELQGALRLARGSSHNTWIPASYEVVAIDGSIARDAMGKGDVLVMGDGDSIRAVAALVNDQLGGTVLSIVCPSSSLEDVLEQVAVTYQGRSIKRMYVDMCGTALAGPEFVHGAEKGWGEYIVFSKDANTGQLDDWMSG